MDFAIPSLSDLVRRTREAFRSNLPATDPFLWPNSVYVSAKVIGERVWEAFHRLDYVKRQAFVLTATGESLRLHAQGFGVTPFSEEFATGEVGGVGAVVGTVIPDSTQFIRSDGETFTSVGDVTVSGNGTFTTRVVADTSGVIGNTEAGARLTLGTAIIGAPTFVEVSTDNPIEGGQAEEGDESLRERLLQRLQNPPHAGTLTDYIRWGLEFPGVTRVFASRGAFGSCTVGVWFMMDDTRPEGIPTDADVEAFRAHILERAPATAAPFTLAPVPTAFLIKIVGLNPIDANVIANIRAELRDLFDERASVSTPSDPFVFRRSWIWQAISNSTGENYHTVELPAEDVVIPAGMVPVYRDEFVTIEG